MMGELQEDVDDDLARSVGSSSQASTLGEQPQQLADGYQKVASSRNGGGGISASSSRGSSPATDEFVLQVAAPAPAPLPTLVVPQPPTLKTSASTNSLSSSMKMPSGKGGLGKSAAAGKGEAGGRERAPSGEALVESRTNIPRTGGTIGRGDGRRRG